MFFDGQRGYTFILSGKSNGRSVHQDLNEGRITITGMDTDGRTIQRVVKIANGEVQDNKLVRNGETVHHVVYGAFETIKSEAGRNITHFRKGGKGKHGKARRHEKLFGVDGVCHSWYKQGRLIRQKFIYDNGRTAYDYNAFRKDCTVKDSEGLLLYEVSGALDGRNNAYQGGHSVFSRRSMEDWFVQTHPFAVKKRGKTVYAGHVVNHQKVGKWVVGGKAVYYEHGVEIPRKLYETPPEKLDPLNILKLKNAQTRMALMAKINPERVAEVGKVIHEDGAMRLYDIRGYEVRILRVQCPQTKSFYFLNVPKDSTECEEARQWTFRVGTAFDKPIKFKIET